MLFAGRISIPALVSMKRGFAPTHENVVYLAYAFLRSRRVEGRVILVLIARALV